MNANEEKMTYKEAAFFLGVSISAINRAIQRGVLTPLPRQGVARYLSSEQVRLFKNKPIALGCLTPEEGATWKETARLSSGTSTQEMVIANLTPEDLGEEHGKRYGRNFVKNVYEQIKKFDPATTEDLGRPLAV